MLSHQSAPPPAGQQNVRHDAMFGLQRGFLDLILSFHIPFELFSGLELLVIHTPLPGVDAFDDHFSNTAAPQLEQLNRASGLNFRTHGMYVCNIFSIAMLDVRDVLGKCHGVEVVLVDVCPIPQVLDGQLWVVWEADVRPRVLDSSLDSECLGGFWPVPGVAVD